MSNQALSSTRGDSQRERLEPFFTDCQTVIVVVEPDETVAQAWQRYVKKHPKDLHCVKDLIFLSFP
jgi:hypothetical protein